MTIEMSNPADAWENCKVLTIRWFDRNGVLFKDGIEMNMDSFSQLISDSKQNNKVGVHIVLDALYSPKELERLSRDMHFFADFCNLDECHLTYGPNSEFVPSWGTYYKEDQKTWGDKWTSVGTN